MAVNNNELLPCPFCGGKAKWKGYYTGSTAGLVECTGCAACARGGNWEKAKEHWNARKEPITLMSPITTVSAGEPQTYVPLRTCHIETRVIDGIEEDFCTACGNELACYYVPHYCPNCGAKVLSEEEQGHMVADAIRRLEKVVEK